MTNPYEPLSSVEVEEVSPVPQGTIKEILAWVDDDPERAELALEEEEKGHDRKTLIATLKDILK